MIRCNHQNGETVFIADRYAVTVKRVYNVDAWGQKRLECRVFDMSTMRIQRDAVATGPEWATVEAIVTRAFLDQLKVHPAYVIGIE